MRAKEAQVVVSKYPLDIVGRLEILKGDLQGHVKGPHLNLDGLRKKKQRVEKCSI